MISDIIYDAVSNALDKYKNVDEVDKVFGNDTIRDRLANALKDYISDYTLCDLENLSFSNIDERSLILYLIYSYKKLEHNSLDIIMDLQNQFLDELNYGTLTSTNIRSAIEQSQSKLKEDIIYE